MHTMPHTAHCMILLFLVGAMAPGSYYKSLKETEVIPGFPSVALHVRLPCDLVTGGSFTR